MLEHHRVKWLPEYLFQMFKHHDGKLINDNLCRLFISCDCLRIVFASSFLTLSDIHYNLSHMVSHQTLSVEYPVIQLSSHTVRRVTRHTVVISHCLSSNPSHSCHLTLCRVTRHTVVISHCLSSTPSHSCHLTLSVE